MNRKGFVSFPFLILFSVCISLCTYLCLKCQKEAEMMIMLKEINVRIQKERQILQEVYCLIQCNCLFDQYIWVDGEEIWLHFEEGKCFCDIMMIEFDSETNQILNVEIQ